MVLSLARPANPADRDARRAQAAAPVHRRIGPVLPTRLGQGLGDRGAAGAIQTR